MNSTQKKNLGMALLALALFAAAGVLYFKDSIFKPKEEMSSENASVANTVTNATGGSAGQPEPDPPNPKPRGSGKLKAP
jgi:hypothetical protein